MKLPHWAQLVLAFLVVAITWVMNQQASGALTLPAAAVTALTIAKTVIGMFSDSVQGRAAASAVGKTLAVLAFGALVGRALMACGLFNPQPANVIPPALTFAECVASDAVAGKSIEVIADDCKSDAISVIASLLSSKEPGVKASAAYARAMAGRALMLQASDAGSAQP